MHRAFYDGRFRRTLFKTGRQVAKSTSLANFDILESAVIPHFKTMYVSPSKEKTVIFSTTRVAKVMRYSPHISKRFLTSDLSDRVLQKQFTNGSVMHFMYADEDPERLRSISSDRNCYDKDAYALTRRGWIPVSALQKIDRVADVNDEGIVEWNPPTDIFTKKYTGKMVTLTHRGFHLRVTGDHKLWLNYKVKHSKAYRQEDKYEFVPALEAAQSKRMGFKLTSRSGWKSVTCSLRKFEGTENKQRNCCEELYLPYRDFARLVGWYLSEGHTITRQYALNGPWKCPRPVLTQNISRGLDDILSTIKRCGLPFHINRSEDRECCQVVIASESLGRYFLPFGKSRDKYIPREFFESTELLEQVLQGIYLGDAMYHPGERWENGTLRTRSRRLAEDVQEAWLRLGRPAVIHTRMKAPNPEAEKEPMYEVCSYERDYLIFWKADFEKKERVRVEDTTGEEVSCFTVKHHRPIVKGNFKSLPCVGSNCYDEVQDILYDPVIIIGNETMANSSYGFETYAGTPKTMENTIQSLWEQSTQSEWVIRCDACGQQQYVDSVRSMGSEGIICLKCGEYLDSFRGQWMDFNRPKEMEYEPAFAMHGFHISQLIMPANLPKAVEKHGFSSSIVERAHERWTRILVKMNDPNYSQTLFKNEVLGVSDSLGERMITKEELEAICTQRVLYPIPNRAQMSGFKHIVGGVDWSGGGTDGVSRTVLWIWGFQQGTNKLVTLFYKIYPGANPVNSIEDIAMSCAAYNVSLVVGDAGGGAIANNLLQKRLGFHRVTQVQYGAPARALTFNGEDRYIANRTTLIDNYLMLLKNKQAEFGKVEDMAIAIDDILNEYEEVTSAGKKVWRHSPQKSDDCLHAGLFGWVAHKIVAGDLRFYQR